MRVLVLVLVRVLVLVLVGAGHGQGHGGHVRRGREVAGVGRGQPAQGARGAAVAASSHARRT